MCVVVVVVAEPGIVVVVKPTDVVVDVVEVVVVGLEPFAVVTSSAGRVMQRLTANAVRVVSESDAKNERFIQEKINGSMRAESWSYRVVVDRTKGT
jgi:hypothetical protein